MKTIDDQVHQLLDRGVAEVPTRETFEKKLRAGKKLRIYLGIDPTGTDLTIGHSVAFHKLRQFQKCGHQVLLLFGTFTAKVGDPTGKSQTRKPLTDEEIAKNMETYLGQVGKILDMDKVEVVKNGDWLSKMTFKDVLKLASTFTVSQMLHRDMYQERMKNNREISLVEFMYPLMQGYDPIGCNADAQIGGSDQLFNLMAGRQIMEAYGVEPQEVITVPLIEGIDGKEKMSKSLGNYIAINDTPRNMFGKTMSIPDSLIFKYFEFTTEILKDEISKMQKQMEAGVNPRDLKVRLGKELVRLYHGQEAADNAEEEFKRMFQKKGRPDDMPQISVPKGEYSVLDLVIKTGLCTSNSDARRMIESRAVKVDDQKMGDMEEMISVEKSVVVQVGKRKFCEVVGKKEEL